MLRKQRSGRSQTGFDGGELDAAEMVPGATHRAASLSGVAVWVRQFGVQWILDNRVRTAGNPKTSGDTKCQRANGNDNQRTTPAALTKPSMSLQFHPLLPQLPLAGLYNIEPSQIDITSVTALSTWIPNQRGWLHFFHINVQAFRMCRFQEVP